MMSGRMRVKTETMMTMFVGLGWKYSGVIGTIESSQRHAGYK